MARRRPPTAGSPVQDGLHFHPSPPIATNKKVASPLTDIPDHLLAEILIRLPSPEDLARISAACVSFRRLATDRSFLRCFRRLHAPPLLGFRDHDGFYPALPPHPSAPAARALALAADFSFSFLPSHCRWAVQDIRDGRVLLHRLHEQRDQLPLFTELVVCDPLHRRYILLPQVPDDLAASVQHLDPTVRKPQCTTFFLPIGEEEAAAAVEETTFRVICMIHCEHYLSTFVFSSSTGQWRAAASKAWSDLILSKREAVMMSQIHPFFLRRQYAYGCFYWDWLIIKIKKLLVFDTRRMEFSMADLPPGEWRMQVAIVEAGQGMLGMFVFRGGTAAGLSYIVAQHKGDSPSKWQTEKRISLDSGYKYCIEDATERYLLLGRTETSFLENPLTEYFSMGIKTLKLQRICAKQSTLMYGNRLYTNFPPSLLSSPTI
uniref:Uncharacterized protein n=1 Tax=Avena sativa TaxID=4498 RepID=A0ACD6ABW1_AVESA